MDRSSVAEKEILKVKNKERQIPDAEETLDYLAVEEPLEIRLVFGPEGKRQTKSISITMRTPGNDPELGVGFLFTEGIVQNREQIKSVSHLQSLLNPDNILIIELSEEVEMDLQKLERNFYTTSSCGVCGKASIDAVKTTDKLDRTAELDSISISPEIVYGLPQTLRDKQDVFESTGGLHASALFDLSGKLIETREDVGRHNALDKLIGHFLMSGTLPLNNHILILSGRASFELIQKAAMSHIKIIAAVGAPSSLAVQMAEEFGITLIGFLRNERFNIYTGSERVKLS
ncbi:MAG: formate dehydrogenase accessory sulfurtransferase FdhD [Flavobacteriales bacterium]|nr:formate dehydrogenase accessory sulfurtransferase FdhD [Flavobacteriales bacterium]